MYALISWLRPVRDLIVMPADRVEILANRAIVFLHFLFCNRLSLPVLRIVTILEHVDTRMSDMWECFMKFSDIRECLSWPREGESEDEVDVEGWLEG